jgi:hypothetical protein
MAITTLDQFVSSTYESRMFYIGGGGGGGDLKLSNCSLFCTVTLANAVSFSQGVLDVTNYPVPLSGVTVSGKVTGTIVPRNATSPNTKYICGIEAQLLRNSHTLCDLLWYNSGMSSTTGYVWTINSAQFASRDLNGRSSGDGVRIGLANSSTSTAPTLTTGITITYTNSSGISNRTGTLPHIQTSYPFGSSNLVTFYLQPGDVGVSSVQTLSVPNGLGAGGVATCSLIAYLPLCDLQPYSDSTDPPTSISMSTNGLIRLYDGASLFFKSDGMTATNTISGLIKFCEG